MGPRHSKRSLDMAGTPTKSEIEGVGNVGKLEKIVDGVVEKVATNGHVEGDLQNGAEPLHNGLEQVQNGDASVVVSENSIEKLKIDEKERDEVINGVNGEVEEKINGEGDEKLESEGKDDKKDKKKDKKEDKKEKVVKKKFSFRSFSFSKKDKSKPKEEKISDAQAKTGIEESPEGTIENAERNIELSKEQEPEPVVAEAVELAVESKESTNIVPPAVTAVVNAAISEVIVESSVASTADKVPTTDDLPPPLPSSPPPTEVKEEVITQAKEETIIKEEEYPQPENISVINKETEETTNDVLTATEQIEEKATDLLKEVEEKVEGCKRKESEEGEDDAKPDDEVASTDLIQENDDINMKMVDEAVSKPDESVVNNMSSIVTMSQSAEDTSDKQEEFGAGESLAEMDIGPEETSNTNEVVVME